MPDYYMPFTASTSSGSYRTAGVVAAANTNATGIQIRRGRIFEVNIGEAGPPNSTDTSIQWDVSRFTAYTTTWVFTTTTAPTVDDQGDASFNGQPGQNATTEGTYSGGSLLNFFINQRAAYRWLSKDGKELVYPATANNGIGTRALVVTAGYTGGFGGTLGVTE